MTCRVFSLKLDLSHISQENQKHLEGLFREAKWFYNYCLEQDDINDADTTATNVPVKVADKYEDRELNVLRSHMKQGIKTRLFNSLSSLKALKTNGRKVGRLKFKSEVNSILLKEYDRTYGLDFDNNRIRIQGLKSWLRVRGMEQIPNDAEIANATLVRKNGDYYLHVTTYMTPAPSIVPEASIGIDFGCHSQLTFSNGIKVEFQIPPSKRLRRLDRKIMRGNRPASKNKDKDYAKRRKEYEKLTNKKTDIRHKIVSAITNCFKYVCFQDESIHAWHAGGHGKKIQHSGIGGIINDLKHKSYTPLEVDRFYASTQTCPKCGKKNKLSLSERTYRCECGFVLDRDVKSAVCIEAEGLKQIPTDCRKFTLGESSTSTFLGLLAHVGNVKVSKLDSLSQEAAGLALR